MESRDRDFRFMATRDLLAQLQSATGSDLELEFKISRVLLDRMQDKDPEVRDLALQWCVCALASAGPASASLMALPRSVAPLVSKMTGESETEPMCSGLFGMLKHESEEHLDVAATALRRIVDVIVNVPWGAPVAQRILAGTLGGAGKVRGTCALRCCWLIACALSLPCCCSMIAPALRWHAWSC